MSGSIPWVIRWLTTVGVIPKAAVTQLEGRRAPSAQSVLDAGRLAENTYEALDELDDDVVLISRMGQNLAQFGLKYSHMGFAVRNLHRGEWGVVHLLNAGDGSKSGIFMEGMVNFYSDRPFRFEASLQTLPNALQAKLKARLLELAKPMHCEQYSLTSYPWSLKTQNSNQWVLEVIAAAGLESPSREHAQAWLREHGFVPSTLNIGLPTQWAGPLLRDSIRFDDQPLELRRAGHVHTVTVDSVINFLLHPEGPFSADRSQLRQLELAL